MDYPTISIVVPVFNGEDFIERAVDSILSQNYPNLDLILMDGGSKDTTVGKIEKYKAHFSHFVSEKDRGQSHAINKGFELANGDIFNWLCHDDTFEPGCLHEVARLFNRNPHANMVIGASRRVYDDGIEKIMTPRPDVLERITYHNGIEQPSAFWKSSLHRKTGKVNEEMPIGMDWEWWCRLLFSGAKAVTTERVFSNYFFPVTSKTSSDPDGNLEACYQIMKRFGPFDGALADAYRLIYEHFDLAGCFDQPCKAKRDVRKRFSIAMNTLKLVFGEEPINSYNWTWIANQKRGKVWR